MHLGRKSDISRALLSFQYWKGFLQLSIPLCLLIISGPLWAQEYNCTNNIDKFDICAEAKRIQAEIAPSLPQMLDESMMISTVTAFDNVLGLNAILLYNMHFLKSTLQKAGRTIESLETQMYANTQNSICSNPMTSAFVKLGGKIIYSYAFADGEKLFQVPVDRC